MKIVDIKDMPNFNSEVKNGVDNVSKKEVYFGHPEGLSKYLLKYSQKTICCIEHGAMNVVSSFEKGRIWRCIECNKGAFEIRNIGGQNNG